MIKKIYTVVGKKYFSRIFIIIFLMALISLVDSALTYIILPFTSLSTGVSELNKFHCIAFLNKIELNLSQKDSIALFSFLIAISYIFRNLLCIFANKYRYSVVADCKKYVSSRVFSAIANKPYTFFVDTDTSSIQSVCISDVTRTFSVIDSLMTVVNNSLTLLLIATILFATNFSLTVTAIVCICIVVLIINRPISRKVNKLSVLYTEHYSAMLRYVQEFIGSLKPVLTSKRQKYFMEKFEKHSGSFAQNEGQYSYLSLMPGYVMNAVIMGVVFCYIGSLSLQGEELSKQIPMLAMFAMASLKLMPSAASLISYLNNIRYNKIGLDSLYKYILTLNSNNSYQINGDISVTENGITISNLIEGVFVNSISFKFNGSDNYLFNDVSLSIPANKMVAFIGTTGSGKTTLADIILGLQIPESGEVIVDGKNINDYSDWWARQIGYIPQNIYLIEDSIKANVAFCVDNEEIDEDKVRNCLEKAQILEYIDSLPEGINTVAGENGIKFSGGQRQRIGIARALYHNPPFLVFDEATSALDNNTEMAIMNTIEELSGEKTILIIAHRLSTIQNCDIVYSIENGVVRRNNT